MRCCEAVRMSDYACRISVSITVASDSQESPSVIASTGLYHWNISVLAGVMVVWYYC